MTFSILGTDTQTNERVELPKTSRPQGLYIIGIQGTGKSGLIENLIMQDIKQQIGVCVLDPHGELIDNVIARLPGKAEDKVIYLDINDYAHPFGLNVFTCPDLTDPFEVQKTIDKVEHIFEKLLGVSTETPLILEYLLRCTQTLIANPGYTMAEIPLLLADSRCRQHLVANVTDTDVLLFWRRFDQMKATEQQVATASTLRRVGRFLQPLTRNIVGQSTTTIDLQDIMNEGKILLVKLSTQVPSVAELIGSVIIALFLNAAPLRPANKRKQFHLYADEFQRFATEDFATLLEEARKFGIGTTIAHQNRSQLDAENKQLETNLKDRSRSVGNLVVFRVNSKDADDLAGEFKISPQAAWEEELEEERLEIRQEERLEMMEVIDGEEYSDTPVKDVVGHLLREGEHPDPVVNEFAHGWLSQIPKSFLPDINKILYNAMVGMPVPTTYSQEFFYNLFYYPYQGSLHSPYPHMLLCLTNRKPAAGLHSPLHTDTTVSYKEFLAYWVHGDDTALERFYEHVRDDIRTELIYKITGDLYSGILFPWTVTKTEVEGGQPPPSPIGTVPPADMLAYMREQVQQKDHATWYHIDVDRLEWELVAAAGESRSNYNYRNWYTTYTIQWQLKEGQEENCYDPSDLEQEVDRIFEEEVTVFTERLDELHDVMEALAEHPLRTGSGIKQPRKRQQILLHPEKTFSHPRVAITHPQRPYQDVKNEIATQLVNLPNFSAQVKIATTNGTVEHIIKTLEPEKGIYGKLLLERIARIRARNVQEKFLRERKDVEAEISQRQFACIGATAPAQPQLPQSPRHARTVPIQGNCPNCGKFNLPGSQFCNQCGTKL